jgi:hypothetical protein
MRSLCASSRSLGCRDLLILLRSKVVDDIVFEVNCQMITIKKGADVDIGQSLPLIPYSWSDLRIFQGANPSAEDQEESLEDGSEQVNNVVHSFRLQRSTFDKSSFVKYLKVFISVCLVRASGDPVDDRDT